jgi:hypothetical protein
VTRPKSRFDQAVFAAVKTNDRRPATAPQTVGQDTQQLLKVREFAVDENAQDLKSSRRGVKIPAARRWMEAPDTVFLSTRGCFHDETSELAGPLQGLLLPGGDYGRCDSRCFGLVAELMQSLAQLLFGNRCQKLRGRSTSVAVHPHVERTISRVGKTTLGIIHLHTGHT